MTEGVAVYRSVWHIKRPTYRMHIGEKLRISDAVL